MSAKRKRLEDTAENSPPEGTPTPKRRKGRISAKERERISEEEESEEHKAAMELLEIYKDAKEKIKKGEPLEKDVNDGDPSSSGCASPISLVRSISPVPSSRASSNGSSDEIEIDMVEDILCALLELTDSTGRLISPPFRVLQSKEEFPVYYEKIRHPMDLKTIAEKARAGLYKRMSQVEADVRLLCRNAQIFSGKGSEIYKDAVALMSFFKEKRDQVLEKGVHPKRYYPDYFDEISRPMSLFMINKKLKRNDYKTFEELFKDFMQVFENACEYNMESSDIFIAAQKLQNLTIRKARELQPSLDLSQYDKKSKASKTPKTPKVLKAELDTDSDDKIGIYWPAGAFMELPSSREYPDYYQVIEHPIDMKIIRDKIENNRYESSVQLMEEFTTLFNNARQYNEANSQIARDAAVLLSMVTTAHATDKDAPYESPLALKQKFG
ncbi:Bromodomain protein [Teladorsagia circumcincta]|uniref:Bromodomain protein n=1 Tax=Teladorsagia circumcincta TaxID=45464 RepID=A0A2G9TW03_TELCI|nr:Bromodomain protein [Teladorsagia circumcincta]